MAYIRSYDTKQRRRGKPVKRYEVVWREPATDATTGLPTGKMRARQESYPTRETAEARRDELNNAKHTTGTATLGDQRKAGKESFAHYAQAWLASQRTKAAGSDKLRAETVDGYGRRLAVYALPAFGSRSIASITSTDCETYLAELVGRGISPATLKHHWSVFSHVFAYARRKGALVSNPIEGVDFRGKSAARRNKRHYPLTAEQVASVAKSIGERYPVYELFTLFAAYTGLRAEELAGCEVRDLVFKPGTNGVGAEICVRRSKKRAGGQWAEDKLKSAKSRRDVPLPSWLAGRMADYLADKHERADDPTAPLWPNRALGGARRRGCRAVAPLDYTEPVDTGAFYKNLLRPALEAVGLPATRPAYTDDDGNAVPATVGVRLHDLRHTFATLQLSSGKPFMLVSKWLGHSTYTLTLDVYGDWIPNDDDAAANSLPEPVASAKPAPKTNVVKLFG
ncbi:tyrosine-type recombinase/integrase [Mycolicibacterium porcinum]|uniref:Site-specific integrase n=1 Tax=Mycolicibacterium porcinum TaxID=39693 RepID=A0ABV3VAY0_9MYCO